MAIQVILQGLQGPLPHTVKFNAISDEPTFLEVTGTVWSGNANVMIGIRVSLDGQLVGVAQIYSNGTTTHRAVVPAYIGIQLTEGEHTLTLSALDSRTVSDSNDFYNAVIHY